MWKELARPRWMVLTVLVLVAAAGMVRLGFWQLERMEQRQAFNARVLEQQSRPTLDLNQFPRGEDLDTMEYRPVVAVGEYQHSEQVALRNQVMDNRPGFHLFTPLKIDGRDQMILVDRGWIPLGDADTSRWSRYDEPGKVEVRGVIRNPTLGNRIGGVPDPTLQPGQTRLDAWNTIDLQRLTAQVSLPLLPVYIQQSPDPSWTGLPARSEPVLNLTEGPHLGYAIQWFTFAAIALGGYPILVRQQIMGERRLKPASSNGKRPGMAPKEEN